MTMTNDQIATTVASALAASARDDVAGVTAACETLFVPDNGPGDVYGFVIGALSVIAHAVPKPPCGHPIGLQMAGIDDDGVIRTMRADDAPPVVRTMARMLVAYLNGDKPTCVALFTAVLDAGDEAIADLVVSVIVQAAPFYRDFGR